MRYILAALLAVSLTGCMLATPYSRAVSSSAAPGVTFSAKSDAEAGRGFYVIFANGQAVARKNADGGISGTMPDGQPVWALCRNQLAGINMAFLPSFDVLCTIYVSGQEVGTAYPTS